YTALGPSVIFQVNRIAIQIGWLVDLKPYYVYDKTGFYSYEKSYSPHTFLPLTIHYNFPGNQKLNFLASFSLFTETRVLYSSTETKMYSSIGAGAKYLLTKKIFVRLNPVIQLSQGFYPAVNFDVGYMILQNH
ncbi:MAG: hypothetical protein ABUL44_00080, partial [Flavobacterium sp.]